MNLNKGHISDVHESNQPEGSWAFGLNFVWEKSNLTNELGFLKKPYADSYIIGAIGFPNNTSLIFTLNNKIYLDNKNGPLLLVHDSFLNFQPNYYIIGRFRYNLKEELEVVWTDNYNQIRFLNVSTQIEKALAGNVLIDDITSFELNPNIRLPKLNLDSVSSGGNVLAGSYQIIAAYEGKDGSSTDWFPYISNKPIEVYSESPTLESIFISGDEGGTSTGKAIYFTLTNVDKNFQYLKLGVIRSINGVITAAQFRKVLITDVCTTTSDCEGLTYSSVFTNTEENIELSLPEIISKKPKYIKSKALAFNKDRLYIANLEERGTYNYQKYANQITVNWVLDRHEILGENTSKNPNTLYVKGSFFPNEVYSFYIGLVLVDGSVVGAYPIPGRPVEIRNFTLYDAKTGATEVQTFSENTKIKDIISNSTLTTPELQDDALISPDVKYFHTRDTAKINNDNTSGKMGFWENETETYPNHPYFEDLACAKVRHHKFPSLRQLTDWGIPFMEYSRVDGGPTDSTDSWVDYKYEVPVFGVEFSNLIIPSDLEDQVVGFQFFYAKRDLTNSTLIGYSPHTNQTSVPLVFGQFDENNLIDYNKLPNVGSVINATFSSVQTSLTGVNFWDIANPMMARYHPFDLMSTDANISGVSYIRNELEMWTYLTLLSSEGDNGEYRLHFETNFLHLYDAIPNWYKTQFGDVIRKVNRSAYQGHNIKRTLAKTSNSAGESAILCEFELAEPLVKNIKNENGAVILTRNEYPLFSMPLPTINHNSLPVRTSAQGKSGGIINLGSSNPPLIDHLGITIFSYLTGLYSYKPNVYNSVFDQELVPFGGLVKICDNPIEKTVLFGGDCVANVYGFKQTKSMYRTPVLTSLTIADPNDETDVDKLEDNFNILKSSWLVPTYSYGNAGLRHASVITEPVIPDLNNGQYSYEEFLKIPYTVDNDWTYNFDYSKKFMGNSVFPVNVADILIQNSYKYPTRIARSQPVSDVDITASWKNFLANDYYDNQKLKGSVTCLFSVDDRLTIFHQYAGYVSVGLERLKLDTLSVALGQGDIFEIAPKETIPSTYGLAGNQSPLATVSTPKGIFFIDGLNGIVYLDGNNINKGRNYFFQRNLKLNIQEQLQILNPEIELDFPQTSFGYLAGFDQYQNRIILVKKDIYVNPEFLSITKAANMVYWNGTRLVYIDSTSEEVDLSFAPEGIVKDLSFTVSYSLDIDNWISHHSYIPDFIWNTREKIFCSKIDNGIFEMNNGYPGQYFNTIPERAFLDVVFNNTESFSINNLNWRTEVKDFLANIVYNKGFTHFTAWTHKHITGEIEVSSATARNILNKVHTNKLRDASISTALPVIVDNKPNIANINLAKPSREKSPLLNNWVRARLIYDNVDKNRILVLEISADLIGVKR